MSAFHLCEFIFLVCKAKKQKLSCEGPRRERGSGAGRGLVGLQPYHFYRWDLFSRALDGAQMQYKWRYTDLNVLVSIGQIFSPYHFKMIFAVPALHKVKSGSHSMVGTLHCSTPLIYRFRPA